ncbi:MAG: hypothetical protein LBH44_07660 [Treponema sp.]|jgi:hypothetical protein|nr:hypothetical protein [Treponema sp.]
MNEKNRFVLNLAIVIVAVISVGAIGFFIGRGNLQRPAQLADVDRRIEFALEESKRELEQERAISNGLRAVRERERSVIDGIAESTRQARMDTQAAINAGGGAADSLQKIIVQMEIYNRYVGNIERQLAEYSDLPGAE